jgi:hypothetical protein
MATDARAPGAPGPTPDGKAAYQLSFAGTAIAGAAALIGLINQGRTEPGVATGAPVVVAVLGLLVSGWAVARRPKDSAVLGLAAATALLGYLATPGGWTALRTWSVPPGAWDGIGIMMWVMFLVAGAAAVLLLLPRTLQRVAVSLFVLYHFAGILSAITSPPPTPWLTAQGWVRLFRPHLEFCYVNNAYQFYSPQPGPANILWFCIKGEDGQAVWLKIPRRSEVLDPLGVEYFRRLSLTERANQNVMLPTGPPEEMQVRRLGLREIYPPHPEFPLYQQYRMPNEHSRQIIASYARYVASTYGTGREGVPVKSVMVYLVQHRMRSQREFAERLDPFHPTTYLPYFVGEFDAEGTFKSQNDPLLYWVVPILNDPSERDPTDPSLPCPVWRSTAPPEHLRNYVKRHAQVDVDPFAAP